MTRIRLDISYDGTDFSGWAVQPDRRTVAGVLLAELDRILGSGTATGLTVAGRTDAGVHATGQVAHVDLPGETWSAVQDTLVRRLAGLLPPDLRVRTAHETPPEFDARFSALYRRYEYRVTDAPFGAEPLRRRDTLAWPRRLDLDRLNEASRGLLGEHDFAAYCRRKENATTIRRITRLDWRRDPDGILVATVQADAFCQNMVRSLMGGLLTTGDGRRPIEWPATLLTRTQRADDVPVVGPHGLTLVEVGYPEDAAALADRAEATRRIRTRLG
ncbi:MAG: tRNA pseudouridine(38-40) synthase TruA [Hamadaea sp.]|uniref:tRNA pseudouridine(38-40) synthase TruA n=1 Tax=Hamadaea sp. TaxID=2024425 RepID=UPI00179CA2CF|nr:tRNA pseudouridine(38-40) synthase TruA [Hamadaea sp.]NUR71267.1 tRNA pseudouridine(38-40) synthase TruA [Hamadaea sp.]NUT23129.1 tRNA pseudouridine(38-40) synthase TruA [Hamadaea sp.]